METLNQSEKFVERISEIPMVSASMEQATNFYRKTKSINKYFENVLNFVEVFTQSTAELSQPVLKIFDGPLVASNKLACDQLNKIQEKYPSVMTTPEELKQKTFQLYDNSSIKSTVDKTIAVKEYAFQKVKNAGNVCDDGRSKFTYFVDRCFKVSDCLIDNYIAAPKTVNENEPSTSDQGNSVTRRHYNNPQTLVYCQGAPRLEIKTRCAPDDRGAYLNRVYRMTVKVTDGMLYRTKVSKVYIDENIVKRLQNLKSVEKLSSIDVESVKNQSMEIFRQFQQKAANYDSERVLLNLIHRSADSVIFISDRLVRFSTPYLPKNSEKMIFIVNNYVQNVNQGFSEAQSLEEVKQKTLDEAKNGFVFIGTTILTFLLKFSPKQE